MKVKHAVTIAGASELADVADNTIRHAIRRGELVPEETADGRAVLLRVRDVVRWSKQVRKPGRKPGSQ